MGIFSIINGVATFTSGSTMHTGSDGAPSSSIIAGKWELDPDDGQSIQLRIPKEKIGTANDRIAFYVSASGRIGIGTKDPESAFDVRDIAEDVSDERDARKESIFRIERKSQTFDKPVTGSIISASSGFVGNLTGDVIGNSRTATQLQTARLIGGTSFDGGSNITPGSATSASYAASSSNITVNTNDSTNEDNLVTFVKDAKNSDGMHGLEMDRDFYYNPSTGALTVTKLIIGNVTISVSGTTVNFENRDGQRGSIGLR
tara:strand:- start:14819 stop:15595 length:777 start_codon:yes stop_codon:yes gene_type:complete